MALPPPGLGGGGPRAGPPPGFASMALNNGPATGGGANDSSALAIVKAQIVFLLSSMTEESFERTSKELKSHFLRRAAMACQAIMQEAIRHYQQYMDDPAAPPLELPKSSNSALAWRLLLVEAVRAAKDISLAPHFAVVMLSSYQSTALPLPHLRILGLSPSLDFSLSAYALATPHIFPPTHPAHESVVNLLRQSLGRTLDLLRAPNLPFWYIDTIPHHPPIIDDLTLQEARTIILAVYPKSSSSGQNSPSRSPSPANPTSPHPSFLSSPQRGALLNALTIKFSSPAIILQTLSALSPGGRPGSAEAIPLEDILFELGENLTQDEGTVEAVITRWWARWLLEGPREEVEQRVTEEASRTVLGLCEGMRDGRITDVHGVVKGLSAIDTINWSHVLKSFDAPSNILAQHSSGQLLLALLLIPPQNPHPPIAGLYPAAADQPMWANLSNLVAITQRLTSIPPDVCPIFTIDNPPSPTSFARVVDPPINESSMSKVARQQAREIQGAGVFNALGLLQVLFAACSVGDGDQDGSELANAASQILERATNLAPELVLLATEKLPQPLPAAIAELQTRLLALYLSTPPANITASQLVFHQMWQNNPDYLMSILLEYYGEDEHNLSRVVEIGIEIKILDKLLASSNLHFSFDVAALVSNKDYLNLEEWLSDGVAVNGSDFLHGIFDFVEHKIRLESDHSHLPESSPPLLDTLGEDVYSIFIRVVRNADNLTPDDIARFKNLRTEILILQPRLLNLRPGNNDEHGFHVAKFNAEMRERVDEMYRRMYSEEIKLDDIVADLKKCKESEDDTDRELFDCALHSLFDEYKFVRSYPPKELAMTGILFGAIIDERLVKDTPAFVATRYVLDACKSSPQEKFYQFGINALSVLRRSLVDFPGLCRSLLEIPAIHESHPVLVNEITSALAEREEMDQQGGIKLAFPALKLPILIEEGDDEFREPDPKKRDAIMFIINQVSASNFETKSQDLAKLLEDQWSRWFAHYFVDVRVSLEPNMQPTYVEIMDALHSAVFEKHVLWETYRKARDLLNSEQTLASSTERVLLKNIAIWLGKITLARNKPIRIRELSLKDLLIQGYDNKRLIVALPFVCNVLACCRYSIVFHPPNPWLVGILSLLVEFYHYAELRLNLKFEIELLFSALEIQLASIEPANVLRVHVPPPAPGPDVPNRLELELHRAMSEMIGGTQRFNEPPVNDAMARIHQIQSEQAVAAAHEAFLRRVDELISQLPEQLIFSPDYPIFQAPTLKRVVHHSIDRSIREIITPVVERSVTIAGISSRDLVSKDFGMEGDPAKLRHAAHLMVQNLAGSLAMVTCKEALRTSMIGNVRAMLAQNGYTDENMPDMMIHGVVNDNLGPACAIVRIAAMEKAAKDIDVNLGPQYAARKAHRESRNQQPFYDPASFSVVISNAALPDPLRLRSGGLSAAQARVYEDFSEPPKLAQASGPMNGDHLTASYRELSIQDSLIPGDIKHGPSPRPYLTDEVERVASPASVTSQAKMLEKFHDIVGEIERLIAEAQVDDISELPPNHEIRSLVHAIVLRAAQSSDREATVLMSAQKTVQLLYKSKSPLGRDVYTLMLQRLCELSGKVGKEVRQWVIYSDDLRKLNVPVTVNLIRASFVQAAELDAQIANLLLRSSTPEVITYAAELIRHCCLIDHPLVPRNGFAATLTALVNLHDSGQPMRVVDDLLDDLRVGRDRLRDTPVISNGDDEHKPAVDAKLSERLAHFFLDWVRVFRSSKNPEAAFVPYIQYLQKENILSGEDVSSAFYRTAIKTAIDLDSSRNADGQLQFFGTDSLAKLIILIVKNYGDKSGAASVSRAVYYYNKIMTIMSYSLVQTHLEHGENFDQRPWTRFFTSMLSELGSLERGLPDTFHGCMKHFANSLGITQPVYAPRFAFGWFSIVTHRLFMPKMLQGPRDDGWSEYHRCLMWMLRFLSPMLKTGDMTASSRFLIRATLRLMLVLLHDFPDFLSEFYHTLSTAIPTTSVQMRNVVLSAFPSSEAPLPSHYASLAELVPLMQRFPTVRSDYVSILNSGNLKAGIDQFVRNGQPTPQILAGELKNRIAVKTLASDGTPTITWNHTMLHAVTFYLGTSAIGRRASQSGHASFDPRAGEVTLLTHLAIVLPPEGQYYLLSVIADQLRYPSAHTLFFISYVLYLFSASCRSATETPNDLAERIARILLERVLVKKPHPFGLVVAFIELLDNDQYGFFDQGFIKAEPEVAALFSQARGNFKRHQV
ncbi:hypothetical protein TREMEDRAFT_72862 [Tremella mesenterica DSM 1558]|uniref:uncharacterized protein n=1 Tax=Tremella mesenterica (strain ATCC 24925 / CBS 8224 / DSM 1558 / NBRC 9311 / NRRL Y-6157 / RJB 2259-6 / UBC 559-6) TaxID=578456 RepID=UPI0003F48F42|nr:uncharacterized protein TREMEDRAFT_72862 [Tremella mesenterica DSM 1558]EIW72732.1 hypothetical protein TREMEDRAFT_72862 [Tremella mesenterica DSM 1558]